MSSILTNNLEIVKKASYTYKAKIKLLNHPTNVTNNFPPVIHCGTIIQTAKLTILDKEVSKKKIDKDNEDENKKEDKKCIYSGDTAIIEIKFMYRPEVVESGQILFLREELMLGVGSFI